MAFKDLTDRPEISLLQHSLERGRLAHAYLVDGEDIEELEVIARTLAKTLNCMDPVRGDDEAAIDCCDACLSCTKTDHETHSDVHWLRPASKTRVITAEQMRGLLKVIHLKPTEGGHKIAIIAGTDRLNTQAANIFLKTLEEPPPRSVMLLLATEPQRIIPTILSRCLRLSLRSGGPKPLTPDEQEWLTRFTDVAAQGEQSLIARYRLLDLLLSKLSSIRSTVEESLKERSPLREYDDVEKDLRDKWEAELAAAIEAEYRHRRSGLLRILQRWLRDAWVAAQGIDSQLLEFPEIRATAQVGQRLATTDAMQNLSIMEQTQRLLHTNVQEALALEVGLLKLKL